MFPKRISTIFLSIILTVSQNVSGFEINKYELYEVGALEVNNDTVIKTTWPMITLPRLELNVTAHNNARKSPTPRCLCGLGLPLPIPIPIPIPVNNGAAVTPPVIGVNNNVAATQLLSDGRTALYNNQGQIIGFLPAGSSVVNNNTG